MSIKFKLIISLIILVVLSLGITIFYLSYKQYKPTLKNEILHRITQNLKNNNNIISKLIVDEDMDSEYKTITMNNIFLKMLENNTELIYVNIFDKINNRKYIFQKNTVMINIEDEELLSPRIVMKTIKKRIKSIKSLPMTKESLLYLVVMNNYKQEFEQHINDLQTINSNFNNYISICKGIIATNKKIQRSSLSKIKKKREIKNLLNKANRELAKQYKQINKLSQTAKKKSDFFDKKMSIIFLDLIAISKNKDIKGINKKNKVLLNSINYINTIIKNNQKRMKKIRRIDEINTYLNITLYSIKKQINSINKKINSINEQIYNFIEIQPVYLKKESISTEKEIFDEIDLIQIYQKIKFGNRTIGYYEVGISDSVITGKIKPIISRAIQSSSIILFISIILSLLLSLYLVYPIHKLDKGADEILRDLKHRIKLKRKDEFGKFAHTFNHLADQLTEELSKYEKLYKEATEDELTKLMVRRYFMQTLDRELENAKKENRPTSLFMTDIDHFKKFNDTYGHQTGDAVLAKVAGTIIKNTRQNRVRNDVPGRYGGEEFALLLPDTNQEEAIQTAERIREEIEKMTLKSTKGEKLKVTISIGVATSTNSDITPKDLIERADKALYNSKETGRNKVSYG